MDSDTRPDPIDDPWEGDPRLADYFGDSWSAVQGFHDLLVRDGVLRGLIGPREVDRLWARHLLNSAAVVQFLPTTVASWTWAAVPGYPVSSWRR